VSAQPDHNTTVATRVVRALDNSLPLSESLSDLLIRHHGGDPFDFARTMVLVPGGRLARALERRLIARARDARAALIAPTIVTPLMFAGRFIEPSRPILSPLGSTLAWRNALDRALATPGPLASELARLLHGRDELPARVRPRVGQRLARLSSEIASSMLDFDSCHARLGDFPDASKALATISALARHRDALLSDAGMVDRDSAIRDAIRDGRIDAAGFDRILILFADPEPSQRALLAALSARGVRVEVCAHSRESLDAEGFPVATAWESRAFPTSAIPTIAITTADGPAEAADAAVAAIRTLPTPRRNDELAVMAPDDETRRALERALELAGSSAARGESRLFGATRLGTLLARLAALVGERSMDALAAFVRHPDVARMLGFDRPHASPDLAIAKYRAETLAERWTDAVVASHREASRVERAIAAVEPHARAFIGSRPASGWAPVIREAVRALVGDNLDGAFAAEGARSVRALDRALAELAAVPESCAPTLEGSEAIELVLDAIRRDEVRGDGASDGVSILRWLDAGIADEPHIILAGFADGLVPEGAVVDPILGDDARRALGMPSGLRRAARDAWILDAILARTHARSGATARFIVPRRTEDGEPLRPSRFLTRVGRDELAARVLHLFPGDPDAHPAPEASRTGGRASFAITPAITPATYTTISVTAFRQHLKCPYLFQLRNDPRLRLWRDDDTARELAPNAFGTLLHGATEAWGREEAAAAAPTTDARAIESSLSRHLDRFVAANYPKSLGAAMKVQIELVRRRLRRFAAIQAIEANEGWRVVGVELAFTERMKPGEFAAPRIGPGAGLQLVGRIDRLDLHPERGFRALDYKTGQKAESATKAHRKGRRLTSGARSGEWKGDWIDLQLPLYRTLLASLPSTVFGARVEVAPDQLGYITLAPHDEGSGISTLDCRAHELDEAIARAEQIVGQILDGDFTPAARVPVGDRDALAPIWGVAMRLGADSDEGGDE